MYALHHGLSINLTSLMGIFRSIGLGIFFLVLVSFMPAVFSELSRTLIVFLQSSQEAFTSAGILASYAGHIPSAPLASP